MRVVCPQKISLAACPSGRRAGWAVRRFDSLVLSEVPNVLLCLCAQGEGAFLRIASQRYKSNEPAAKGHSGPSTVSESFGKPKHLLAREISFGQIEGKPHHILLRRRNDYLRTPTYNLDRAWRTAQIHSKIF